MKQTADFQQIRQDLLCLLPEWNYQITKPFKQLLTDEVSIEMFYCLRILDYLGGTATMSELGSFARMPKQHMTKMANRLTARQFVTRESDASDRRHVRLRLTDKAIDYLHQILSNDSECFSGLLNRMSAEDLAAFHSSIRILSDIFKRLPHTEN